MGDFDYWIDVSFNGEACGAGFLLTRRYVLTAAHCLRRRKVAVGNAVTIARENGDTAAAMVVDIDSGRDVALIRVTDRLGWTTLTAATDRCDKGDGWESPYRPARNVSQLRGWVLTSPIAFQCSGGQTVEALELQVEQVLGDYGGYSGSPVQRDIGANSAAEVRPVVGMLIEQDPHRVREEATNVLFAITIAEAMAAFDDLQGPPQFARLDDSAHRGDELWRTTPPASRVAQVAEGHFAGVRAAIVEVKAMVDEGLVPGTDLAERINEMIRSAAERTIEWGGRHESSS